MTYGYIDAPIGIPDYHFQHFGILSHAASYGLGQVNFIHEGPDRPHDTKPILSGMLDNLHRGDTLIVTDFSKLGDTTVEVLDALTVLSRRGVRLYVVSSEYRLDNNADALVVNMACSLIRMIEKELQVRPEPAPAPDPFQMPPAHADLSTPTPRTRKRKLDGRSSEIEELLSTGISMSEAALRLGVSRPTLADWAGRWNLFIPNPPPTT